MNEDECIESWPAAGVVAAADVFVPEGQATIAQQFTAGSREHLTPVQKRPVGTTENAASRFDCPYGTGLASTTPSLPAINRWAIVKRPYGSKRHRSALWFPHSLWFPRSAWELPSSDALRQPRRRGASRARRSHAERGNERVCLLLFLVAILSGCSASKPPEFRLNTEGRDAATIGRKQKGAIEQTLTTLFGTPDVPAVPDRANLRLSLLKAAAGPIGGDAEGNQWGLFRRHCAGCHGISGDGAGAAAAVLDPYPRDFRNGVFKYTSTGGGAKPLGEDLLRTLQQGIPGTAMPSFRKLPGEQLDVLLEYVKYLAVRGETELHLFETVVDEDASLPPDVGEVVEEGLLPAARSWDDARTMAVVPPSPPSADDVPLLRRSSAAIARGRKLFAGAGQCVRCHGPLGDGRGEQAELYDDWNKRKVGSSPEQVRKLATRFRLPIERLHPRDFTRGIFHGGDRPIDQYWRIYVGIKGTPMPPHGPSPGSKGVLTPEEIWDVVYYVRSLAQRDEGW
jgi:mono/diheme cytochrome c family protein